MRGTQKASMWAIGAVVLVALALPLFVTDTYFLRVITLSCIFAVLAVSFNLLTGYSGLLTLGHQAFFGVGAYVSALLATRSHLPYFVGLVAGALGAAACGYFVARITLRLRDAYFVIATIALANILGFIALNWVDVTQGPMGITNVPPPSLFGITADTPTKAYYMILVFVAFAIAVSYRLVNSEVGRSLVAMREFENLARSVGIDTRYYAMNAYVVSAMLAGMAGSFYAHYMRFLSPDVFSFDYMVNIVVMTLAGGLGTMAGPVIGAFVFTVVPEALRFSREYRLVLLALAIILLVRFLPQGLMGLLRRRTPAPAPAASGVAPPSVADEGSEASA